MKPKFFRQRSNRDRVRARRYRRYGHLLNLLARLLPAVAIHLLSRLWFSAPRYRSRPEEQTLLNSARCGFFLHEGRRLCYHHWGSDGPLAILIHGWSGHGGQMAAIAQAMQAEGYQLLALDAPAHGCSQGRHTDLFAISRAWQALLQNHRQPELVITHSFGGIVACYAISQGLLPAQALVLIASPPSLDYLVAGFEHGLDLSPALAQGFRTHLAARYGEGFWQVVSPMATAAQIDIPTLVCHGQRDTVLPMTIATELARRFPRGQCHISPKQGHRSILSDPATLMRLTEFVKDPANRPLIRT